ncbi:phage tail sheath family protein [Paenibacillus flagellatus]|uniref:Phage tail sheath protein n=1 Tax=Paenibacillus flagellatus TaxID=2211139 RepID=A0A2V5K3V2_9BACL|nr:phage tail sheath family protein [Paenibacillus flagellatus]PYI52544.1 phage tail sheath protein [Paenibacillus flagellatus]
MAGGTWSTTDRPVLPGMYMNFQAAAIAAVQPGARGVVALPVKAHWGPVKQFVEITSLTGADDMFTSDETGGATAYSALKLALLGGARTVLAYRIADADAAKASCTLQDTAGTPENVVKLEAKYPGERGNRFKVTVQTNPVDASKKDIRLFEGTTLLKTFTFAAGTAQAAVDTVNQDPANKWIVATNLADGNGQLKDGSSFPFGGGDSGIDGVAAGDYTNALSACETQEFNLFALDGVSDSGIQASVVSWVNRVRSEGKPVIAVLGGSAADDTGATAVSAATSRSAVYNHEAVVNVGTGAVLDGVSYSSAQLSAYVAGLIAGQKLSESTTYAPAPFQDVTRRWTRSEQEQAAASGVFLFVHDGKRVKALRGVNSLTSLRQGQSNAWKKIRTIRVMDAIQSDLAGSAEAGYIGKVNNTAEGRLALIGAAKQYMQSLAQSGVIEAEGWDVYLNPQYYGPTAVFTPEPDQVYLNWEARLTDAMEQIFGTFIVL